MVLGSLRAVKGCYRDARSAGLSRSQAVRGLAVAIARGSGIKVDSQVADRMPAIREWENVFSHIIPQTIRNEIGNVAAGLKGIKADAEIPRKREVFGVAPVPDAKPITLSKAIEGQNLMEAKPESERGLWPEQEQEAYFGPSKASRIKASIAEWENVLSWYRISNEKREWAKVAVWYLLHPIDTLLDKLAKRMFP